MKKFFLFEIFIFCLKFRTIFFPGIFSIFWQKSEFLTKKSCFCPNFFFKLAKWKIFRRSWKSGKFSDSSEIFPQLQIFQLIQFWKKLADFFPNWKIFHLLQMFQFIWFYWKNFHLLQSVWKLAHFRARINKISQFSKKLEKWKIFQFTGKFSSTANIPIHQILEENKLIFRSWKIFHLLHSGWNFA